MKLTKETLVYILFVYNRLIDVYPEIYKNIKKDYELNKVK
jgi:hypothetical protein